MLSFTRITEIVMTAFFIIIILGATSSGAPAGFAPIASEVIYINGPGAITPDYANIPYTKRDANYWPKVENPFEK